MPRQTTETEWPWLKEEEAEALVAEGIHAINFTKVCEAATSEGYDQLYYTRAGNHDAGNAMETLAFRKATTVSEQELIIKVLYYPRSRTVAVCHFMNLPPALEKPFPPTYEDYTYDNFYSDCLGIVPPSGENSDVAKPDALFNPNNSKNFALYSDVSDLEKWHRIICEEAPVRHEKYFLANGWTDGRWQTHKSPVVDRPVTIDEEVFNCTVRWHHIAMARGYGLEHSDKITKVCDIMEKTMYWDGIVSPARMRYSCGSACAISGLLLEIAKEHHGAAGCTHADLYNITPPENRESLPLVRTLGDMCDNYSEFVSEFGKSLDEIRAAFVDLPHELRLEMLNFFFERSRLGLQPFLLVDLNKTAIMSASQHGAMYCASVDHSRLFAGEGSEVQYDYYYGLFRAIWDNDGDNDSAAPTEIDTSDWTGDESLEEEGEEARAEDGEG